MQRFARMVTTGVFALLGGCRQGHLQPMANAQSQTSAIRAELASVRGQFVDAGDLGFSLDLESPADQAAMDEIVHLDSLAVPTLVECIADTTVAAVTYPKPRLFYRVAMEERVSTGTMCFITLLNTRWYQRRRREGKLSDEFRSVMGVELRGIHAEQQAQARAAWQGYLKENPIGNAWSAP